MISNPGHPTALALSTARSSLSPGPLPKKESSDIEGGEDNPTKLWLANQLGDDAHASGNFEWVSAHEEGEADIGGRLREFGNGTERMPTGMLRNNSFICRSSKPRSCRRRG
jgi:hypothetical protein